MAFEEDIYRTDPEAGTVAGWIKILQIIGKYHPKDHPIAGAAHDIVWLNLSTDDVEEDSEDGIALHKLGLHVEEDGWATWA